ncbi:MAG TPA: trypsin-like peptidase domain-containing protein [Gaiellaceae bacterium]|nr:trypsin-like peptidase domain-containing protein [Gaiellaceae bacterium]
MRNRLPLAAAVVAAAFLGGGTALAIGAAVWDGGTTTVVQQAPARASVAVAEFAEDESGGTIGEIYRDVAPGVVQITSDVVRPSLFGEQRGQSLGSGFVIDKDGHIVTNFHVIEDARQVYVNFSQDDGLEAEVVGTDPSTDLAVLKVDAPERALTPLSLGDSEGVRVGDEVVAIGNPFGLERTVTAGIVSALQRQIASPDNFTIDKVIQTDAPINQGNSGGPLLNAAGEVIGVNTQIATGGAPTGNVGIGFAVPSNTVQEVVGELIEDGRADHAYLGVEMLDISDALADQFNLPANGALVAEVVEGSPADQAGLRGGDTDVIVNGQSYRIGGDVVTEADGQVLASADELRAIIASKEPGDALALQVQRDGESETVNVELGRRPTETG